MRLSCSAYDAVTPAAAAAEADVDLMATGARSGGGAAAAEGAGMGATVPDTADSGCGGRIILAGAVGAAVLAARRSSAEGAETGGPGGSTAGKPNGSDWD